MLSLQYHLSVERQGNLKMSIVSCSASSAYYNICDTVPLDTSSNIA